MASTTPIHHRIVDALGLSICCGDDLLPLLLSSRSSSFSPPRFVALTVASLSVMHRMQIRHNESDAWLQLLQEKQLRVQEQTARRVQEQTAPTPPVLLLVATPERI
eukprot:689961-Amphidinium_carterae.1